MSEGPATAAAEREREGLTAFGDSWLSLQDPEVGSGVPEEAREGEIEPRVGESSGAV